MDEKLLPSDEATRSKRMVLHGLGGIGKTQIAVEYANSRRKNYSAVIWVSVRSEQTLKKTLATFAEKIPLPDFLDRSGHVLETRSGLENAYNGVKEWLDFPGNHKWLIVFDNVDKHEVIGTQQGDNSSGFDIRRFIPGQGTVIITTRLADLRRLGDSIEITEVPIDDGLSILCNASGRDADEDGE